MIKITGLDQLSRQLEDAKKALQALDGQLTTVNFDPWDPSSIEVAIQHVSTVIDEKVGPFTGNPIVGTLAQQMKDKYRGAIVEKALAERMKGNSADA